MSLRCSLDADASGASGERPRDSRQLHHCGDVGQLGEPLACEASVSRFEPGTSHQYNNKTQTEAMNMKLLRIQQQYGDSTRINYKYMTIPTTPEKLLMIVQSLPQVNPVECDLKTIKNPSAWSPGIEMMNADIQKELKRGLTILRQRCKSKPGTWHCFILDIIDFDEMKTKLINDAETELTKIPKTNSKYSLVLDFYATTGVDKDIKEFREAYLGDKIVLEDTLHLHSDDNNHIIEVAKAHCLPYLEFQSVSGEIREHNKNVISLETLVEKQLIDAMLSNQTRKIHIDNISIDNACWSDNIQSCVYINTEDSYHQSVKDELKKELDLLKAYER